MKLVTLAESFLELSSEVSVYSPPPIINLYSKITGKKILDQFSSFYSSQPKCSLLEDKCSSDAAPLASNICPLKYQEQHSVHISTSI